jgi:hypothetical protein
VFLNLGRVRSRPHTLGARLEELAGPQFELALVTNRAA